MEGAAAGGSGPGPSRRKVLGGAAIGAAVIWTSQFPFAGDAIGQTIDGGTGPTGPTGPTGAGGSTGSTGTAVPGSSTAATGTGTTGTLATTGVDPAAMGALGTAALATGGAIMWWKSRNRGGDSANPDTA